MPNPEVFYIHINGEQRGPYTVPQIDHLLNSGLIPAETTFWREGLEQWLPVTNLVELRRRPNPWKRLMIAAAVIVPILLVILFFGPAVADAWREATAREYTQSGAYWRARDTVRQQALPAGSLVEFDGFDSASVELIGQDEAKVLLRGRLMPKKEPSREASWRVRLKYDPSSASWSSAVATLEPSGP